MRYEAWVWGHSCPMPHASCLALATWNPISLQTVEGRAVSSQEWSSMGLSVGIVGLPNVGKSTIFNALTAAGAQSANYPFCTIEPNVGIVPVVDARLDRLARLANNKQNDYAYPKVVDIAGLVRGASKRAGLGNHFLANIR